MQRALLGTDEQYLGRMSHLCSGRLPARGDRQRIASAAAAVRVASESLKAAGVAGNGRREMGQTAHRARLLMGRRHTGQAERCAPPASPRALPARGWPRRLELDAPQPRTHCRPRQRRGSPTASPQPRQAARR